MTASTSGESCAKVDRVREQRHLEEPLRLESDGTIKLSERPGLGIELDRGAIERYRSA